MIDCSCKADMVDLRDFTPKVLEKFPTAPLGMVESHVRDACIVLCQKSGYLEREASIHVSGVRDFPLITDENEVVVRVTQVLLDGVPLRPTRSDNPKRAQHACSTLGNAAFGEFWVEALDTPDASVHIDALECGCHGHLTVRYQVAPSGDACKVDRRLLTEARQAVVYGALMTLVDDTNKSMLHERRFKDAISDLRRRKQRGRNGSHGFFKPIDTGI